MSVYSASDWPRLAPLWTELAEISPHSSFYLSPDWTAAWLEVFGDSQPRILIFEKEGRSIGACFLTSTVERRGPFRLKRIYLNTGEPRAQRTLMEFNNILCVAGKDNEIAQALGTYLHPLPWDEFAIEGICPGPVLTALQACAFPQLPANINSRSTFYVNLDDLRRSGLSYLDSLSSNTRSQIRRSLRQYAGFGAIETHIAADLPQAEMFFAEMCRLHQSTWSARGESGAFAPGRRLEFHRALIRRAHPKGGIQLLRVSAGGETIGILYNFIQNGKVYFFQSGFNYMEDARPKPGLVTHSCAIQHYLEAGFSEYDFLAGKARYKASLANNSRSLAWVVFSRPNIRLASIELLRVIKRRLKRLWQL